MVTMFVCAAVLAALAFSTACTQQRANTPAVKEDVERALKQAGLDKINVDENRDKGVITLKGDVNAEADKTRAAEVAQSAAAGRVIANEIAVRPEGAEGQARKIDSNTDDAIENYFKAQITAHRWENQHVQFNAKNGVLTLHGDVDTAAQRAEMEKVAAKVPGVQQVVNELEVKKASNARK
jgi:hyperosmotically inducible protein